MENLTQSVFKKLWVWFRMILKVPQLNTNINIYIHIYTYTIEFL